MIPSTHDEAKEAYENGAFTLPGLVLFGDYNTAPEPMCKITTEEYFNRLLHWQVIAIETRQPDALGHSTQCILCIHWLNTGNGVGMSQMWRLSPGGGYYSPVYWLIGCAHSDVATTIGNCLHRQVCQDCGYTTIVDSSG